MNRVQTQQAHTPPAKRSPPRGWFVYFLSCSVVSDSFETPWMVAYQTSGIFCPWDSPGKNIGVGCHALLQGIFPTQGSNPRLLRFLHGQAGSYPLSHMASLTYGGHQFYLYCMGDKGALTYFHKSVEAMCSPRHTLGKRTKNTRSLGNKLCHLRCVFPCSVLQEDLHLG